MAQLEPGVFVLLMAVTSYLIYKLFLGGVSPERHRNLRREFKRLTAHALISIGLFFGFWMLQEWAEFSHASSRVSPYIGLLTVIWGAIVLIKTCRILAFEYLFFFNMQSGVPLLLVNLLSLIVSLVAGAWILSGIFNFQLGPVVATSAAFSIVLGLAMQDTLGNLFAGVALQLDKPFSLGDWVEVYINNQKVVGKVDEVSWRATVLISVTDELITIPNRVMAQSQISNFSPKSGPIVRSQIYRIPFGSDLAQVREWLISACENVRGVRKHPSPIVFFTESTESWIVAKLIYSVDDYGAQFLINDRITSNVLEKFQKEGQELAHQKIVVIQPKIGKKDAA